ncbi:MAG: DegT/DnrJ/EryC1/StrS family aminotransferase [Bacteroidota bacterium]
MSKNIFVTRPYLPPLEEFIPYLEEIWGSRTLTNNGPFHQQLEQQLCDYLGVKYISLFSNGTLALITALHALQIKGEVITTPFSFVATTHSLWWNNISPVFVDIEPETYNIDPVQIEKAITTRTAAILPVHVYGTPCQIDKIQAIARKYNLKVIYDAAHAFGVKINGNSVMNFGDLSILSFHATKVFNTFEGGAIVCHDPQMKRHIDDLKNFGFRDEVTVVTPGINAKMNEFQAALGLLQLKYLHEIIAKRRAITTLYYDQMHGIPGIYLLPLSDSVSNNYSYLPVLIKENEYGKSRDMLFEELKRFDIFGRRYFYPLISQFPIYQGLSSAKKNKMPVAERISQQVICLPIYPDLDTKIIEKIVTIIKSFR